MNMRNIRHINFLSVRSVVVLLFTTYCFVVHLFLPFQAYAQSVETIESFIVDITVTESSEVKITESISYFFPEEKHGIYRCIPTTHPDSASTYLKERYIDIEVQHVLMDGVATPFTVDKNKKEICIKVGDPGTTVTGVHLYELVYVVGGVISYPEFGGAELYWNATGHAWDVTIKSVMVRVRGQQLLVQNERACYLGEVGKAGSCAVQSEGDVSVFRGGPLKPYEGLTIAQAVNRSKIAEDIRERFKSTLIFGLGLLSIIVVLATALYRYKTKHKKAVPIIPQYEPYTGIKPMYTGVLFDNRLDPHDITAGIVYLAERGYIKIRKTEKKVLFLFEVDDYEITCLRTPDDALSTFEQELLKTIFMVEDDNAWSTVVGTVMSLSSMKAGFENRRKRVERIRVLKETIEKALYVDGFVEKTKFLERIKSAPGVVSGLGVGILIISGIFSLPSSVAGFGFVCIFIGIVSLALFQRRTPKGYEALNHLKGFKQFLSVTETHRYIFHNAPEKNAEQFMEYLPYAIAFGVEKEWAKVFEGVTIPNPSWYEGGMTAASFDSTALTHSLGGFATAFAQTGSSGSASSGGGFSGGGSGGGGGGSW